MGHHDGGRGVVGAGHGRGVTTMFGTSFEAAVVDLARAWKEDGNQLTTTHAVADLLIRLLVETAHTDWRKADAERTECV